MAFATFPDADIRLAQVMVGVEVPRLDLDRLLELRFREVVLSKAREIRSQIGPGGGRIRLQAYCLFEVRVCLGVLGLPGINQPEQFVHLKAFGNLSHDALQTRRSLGILP